MTESIIPPHRPRHRRRRRGRSSFGDGVLRLVAAPMVALVVRLLAWSLRWTNESHGRLAEALGSGRPVIFAFWHEDVIGATIGFLREGCGSAGVMVSRSRDGDRLSWIIYRLGMHPIRASSSRGGVGGFLELKRWLTSPAPDDSSRLVSMALDGPRGPRRVVKPGTALLARKTNALVLPVAFEHSRQWVFGSWDRMRLPWPLSRTRVHMGEVLDASEWGDDDTANAQQIQTQLDRLMEKIDAAE